MMHALANDVKQLLSFHLMLGLSSMRCQRKQKMCTESLMSICSWGHWFLLQENVKGHPARRARCMAPKTDTVRDEMQRVHEINA